MTRRISIVVLLLPLLAMLGCKSKSEPAPEGEADAPFEQPLLEKIKKAGLEVGEFEKAASRPYKAEGCVRGEVEKLDVLLCRFVDEATNRKSDKALVTFVGTAISGAVRHVGSIGVVVADREKADLKGERINRLLKVLGK